MINSSVSANGAVTSASKFKKPQEYVYSSNPYMPFSKPDYFLSIVSFFAIGVVTDIFSTGKNLSLLNMRNLFEWGIQNQEQIMFSFPESMNIDDTNPPAIALSSEEFVSKFLSICIKDIETGDISPQWIIENLNYIIGYAVCHLEWTLHTMNSCRKFLAFYSVSERISESQKDVKVLENLFFLESMKPKISSSLPFLECTPNNDDSSILKLSFLFHRYDMIGVTIHDIKLLKEQFTTLLEPIPLEVMSEIEHCVYNLLSDKSSSDLKDSLNWFRKSPSKTESQELESIGYSKYSERYKEIDSTLVAQHLKKQLLKVKLGLIPESICNLLVNLIQDKLSNSSKGGVWLLLSLSETRFKIIQSLLQVTNRIISETNVPTKNLATVVLVNKLKEIDSNSLQSIASLREDMERWNNVWGQILGDNDFLTVNEEIDSKMLELWSQVLYELKFEV